MGYKCWAKHMLFFLSLAMNFIHTTPTLVSSQWAFAINFQTFSVLYAYVKMYIHNLAINKENIYNFKYKLPSYQIIKTNSSLFNTNAILLTIK